MNPHWQLVERYSLQFLDAGDAQVRAVAATCIGHLVRIHKRLDMDLVSAATLLEEMDTEAASVEDAL